jgi:hypothetical protein
MKAVMNDPDIVAINFNRWFTSKEYRKRLTARLDIPFNDEGLSDIIWPGVSTFDGSGYDGRAQQMKVLERWKPLGKDFIETEMDDEMIRYAEDFFNIKKP